MRNNYLSLTVLLSIHVAIIMLTPLTAISKEKTFPNKPIEIIVPFKAGGVVDGCARVFATEVEKILNQKVLITNKAGGGSTVAAAYVSHQKPDGYTILFATSSAIISTVTKKVPYKYDDFDAIMMYSFDPPVVAAYVDSPYKSLKGLMETAKTKNVKIGTAGHSTNTHIAATLLENKYKVKFKYTHTKGSGELVPMIAGGHVPAAVGAWSDMKNMVKQGKIRILGVFSEERDSRDPNIPTLKELGYDVKAGTWRGIVVPAGIPPKIKTILHKAFKKAFEGETLTKNFESRGVVAHYKSPNDFQAFIKYDHDTYAKLLSEN